MQSLSGISRYVLVALYVLAIFPFISYATQLNKTSIQRRDADPSPNLIWMDTAPLPSSPNYPSDYATYEELREYTKYNDGLILQALYGAFLDFIQNGESEITSPGGSEVDAAIGNVNPMIYGVSNTPTFQQTDDWFTGGINGQLTIADNLATWVQNWLSSENTIECCGCPYYNDKGAWGSILVTVGWGDPSEKYKMSGEEIEAKLQACLTASY